MTKELPSPQTLRKLLRYEPETGRLYWRERDKEAFTSTSTDGYRCGAIWRRTLLAHRVIWAMQHDAWPEGEIDHINGTPDDNRISNLRDVTHLDNMVNRKRPRNNKSGFMGVHWHRRKEVWRATIRVAGKSHHLGSFDNFEEACYARKQAEREFGYHPNHGRIMT